MVCSHSSKNKNLFMENYQRRNFVGRKLVVRISFQKIFIVREREHPTVNTIKNIIL